MDMNTAIIAAGSAIGCILYTSTPLISKRDKDTYLYDR